MRKLVSLLTLILALNGCAFLGLTKAVQVTGESIALVGEQFTSVSTQIAKGCDAGTIPTLTCNKYKAFEHQFKRVYPLTVGLWTAAKDANDANSQAKAEGVITSLATDLSTLAVEALGAFAPGVK